MSKFLFPLTGIAAIVWVLIRVIPKPSRLSYPCMQAAMPIASGFLGYIGILLLSGIAFWRSKKTIMYYPVFFLGAFVVFGLSGFLLVDSGLLINAINAPGDAVVVPNQPMGIARGIFPGRVVWVHNQNAVNQNCRPDSLNHAWWAAENSNLATIDSMISAAIDSLTGQTSDSAAWQALFQFNNAARGKGAVDYAPGEKIFIKINQCSGWSGNYNVSDLTKRNTSWYGMSETTPTFVLAVMHQLIDIAHIPQTDIYVGDPIRNIYKEWYDQWHPTYPDVHYIGHDNYTTLGREQVTASTTAKIYYSDRGQVLRPNVSYSLPAPGDTTPIYHDALYTIFEDAEYLIDLPQLKGHMRAGVTMFAKNHFGSQTRSDAMHLHMGLPCPIQMENDTSRQGYGLYRIQVDLMTQSLLREKNLIFLMDALWGTDYEQDKPLKWQMAPFNNTYSSSVFASLDNVAIESVGYDFLRSEFTVARAAALAHNAYVQMRGADDYLHQAADSTNWPVDIRYDPDSTGVHIFSLGVHEHWNNAADKQYTRNLGSGEGIELLEVEQGIITGIASQGNITPSYFELCQNYPNPFNPSTTIRYQMLNSGHVTLEVYDVLGRVVATLVNEVKGKGSYEVAFEGSKLSSGIYITRLTVKPQNETKSFTRSMKMLMLK